MLIVLWALGWAMIVLSALVWLPASPVSAKFMVGHPIAGRSFFCALGLGLTAAFFLLRAINVYGDTVRWSTEKSAAFTVLSFLNTNKYPPSLLFFLMTLGPAMLFLGLSTPGHRSGCDRHWSLAKCRCFIICCTYRSSIYSRSSYAMRATDRCIGCSSRRQSGSFRSHLRPDGDSLFRSPVWSGLSLWSCFIRFAVGLHPRSSAAAMPGSVISELG